MEKHIHTLRWHITAFWEAGTKTLYGQGICMLPNTAQIIPNVGMILAYKHKRIVCIQNKWIIKIRQENRLSCLFCHLKQQAYTVQWNIYSPCFPFADLFFWIDYLWKLSWHELLYGDKREVKRSISISYNADQLLVKLSRPGRTVGTWSEDCIYHKLGFTGKSNPPSHFHRKQKN